MDNCSQIFHRLAHYSTLVTLMPLLPNQLNPLCPPEALLGDHPTSLTLAPPLLNQLDPPVGWGAVGLG